MTGLQPDESVFRIEDWNAGRSLISTLRHSPPWLCWLEMRFEEGGRHVLVRTRVDEDRADSSGPTELLGSGTSVVSEVYEYGGGAYALCGPDVVLVEKSLGGLGRWTEAGGLVPLVPRELDHRFGDLDARGELVVAVRERPGSAEAVHEVVVVSTSRHDVTVLAQGRDFYAAPRLSPDSTQVCFLAWDHPAMPWDAAELHVLDLATGSAHHVAGGTGSSVLQPRWTPEGELVFLHDDRGHWEPRSEPARPGAERRGRRPAYLGVDLAAAPWALGISTTTLDGASLVAASPGLAPRLARWDFTDGAPPAWLDHEFESIAEVVALGAGRFALVASRTGEPEGVHLWSPGGGTGVLATTRPDPPPPAAVSPPRQVWFPARDGAEVAALWFAPTVAVAGSPPPVIVNAHGGPTYAAWVPLDYRVQFWTSRGFGVLDVDYRGSSGRGRAYRDALYGAWGRLDVEDCVDGARWLVARGWADPDRLVIRGESAGGYTALCAAAYDDTFAIAIAHYGVSDPGRQAVTTHKFESRYVGQLIGTAEPRAPLRDVSGITARLLLTHGGQDTVVPPEQTRALADAVRARGVTVRHIELAGEGHGYKDARSVTAVRRAEAAALDDWL